MKSAGQWNCMLIMDFSFLSFIFIFFLPSFLLSCFSFFLPSFRFPPPICKNHLVTSIPLSSKEQLKKINENKNFSSFSLIKTFFTFFGCVKWNFLGILVREYCPGVDRVRVACVLNRQVQLLGFLWCRQIINLHIINIWRPTGLDLLEVVSSKLPGGQSPLRKINVRWTLVTNLSGS